MYLLCFYSILLFCTNSWRRRVFYFCTFLFYTFAVLLYFAFCTNSGRRRVLFILFVLFTFLSFFDFLYFSVLYFCTFLFVLLYFHSFVLLFFCIFVLFVLLNFHAKSGICSSKNGWVMSTFVLFCTFCTFVFCLDCPYELPCKIWTL